MISRDDLNLRFAGTLAMESQHAIKYRDSKLGITTEAYTNRKQDGSFGKGQTFYFIDNDDREFLDVDSLIEAYNERFKFEEENPKQTIKYVRVIIKN